MPFGVELPDNITEHSGSEGASSPETVSPPGGTPSDESKSTESSTRSSSEQSGERPSSAGLTKQELIDIDKLDRFRQNGKEVTKKEWLSRQMMQSDYTRKSQELAETRKFADNFEADIEKVMRDPSRLAEFKAVYPKTYADLAERYLGGNSRITNPTASASNPNQPQGMHPAERRLIEIESKFQQWEQAQFQNEVQRIDSWLDNQYDTLAKKFPFAENEIVSARAEALSNQGTQITQQVLDKLFKQNHDEIKAKWEKTYKDKVNEQLKVGVKGRDIGKGGGTPAQAPRGFKTMKEAKDAWLSDIEAKRGTA
jgi:hypothetical protein